MSKPDSTTAKPKSGKQSAENAAKTKAHITECALNVFAQQGYEAASLRDIAQRAGVTHGTLRHHFGSKHAVWTAVADQVLLHYQQRLLPILNVATQNQDYLAAFEQVVRGFISVSLQNPPFARLLIQECTNPNERSAYVQQHFLAMHQVIGDLFNNAQQQSGALAKYTNDSFFLSLLSLTFFPLMMPDVSQLLSAHSTNPAQFAQEREQLIIDTLFGQ